MNTSGIGKVRGANVVLEPQVRKNRDTAADRDADRGSGYDNQKAVKALTPEQEEEALKALNDMASFSKAGLRAEFVREEGKPIHIIVKDASGAVIRHLPYEQIVSLYLQRGEDKPTGRLINKAA